MKRRKLGRGIGGLIADHKDVGPRNTPKQNTITQANSRSNADKNSVVQLDLRSIAASPFQPRLQFADDELRGLADSIKAHGVMQPILVRLAADEAGSDRYELIAGERRVRAAKLAGLEKVPAIVREVQDQQAAEWAIIENVQRADLNAVERALGVRSLMNGFGLTHRDVADRLGLSRPAVTNLLRLLDLDERTQRYIVDGTLTAGHGRALLACTDAAARERLALQCVEEHWSVRRTEEEARREMERVVARAGSAVHGEMASNPGAAIVDEQGAERSPEIRDLEQRLGEYLKTRVLITAKKSGKGRITVEFFDLDHFDAITDAIGFRS